ncbi:methyltransferase domain-containing protein [Acetobacter conturbans]|uniref:Methyltransferase type 11 domain-containing protein n=1 Tax=Acetobacter conturbans TaxID=1737472 RepID=A0ABX0K038_9PROT|nr:hypothetical protein [Acetobacter conturbans]NHN87099.1 hypothetical protein [Acetobacter conturbans]
MPAEKNDLPPDFDCEFYKGTNIDLAQLNFNERELIQHFIASGEKEGRAGSPGCLRGNILPYIEKEKSILEIGPFTNPMIKGENVKYFDVLSTPDLVRRAEQIGFPLVNVPHIDFVSPTGDLDVVDEVFSCVVSSHNIEHQIDLVTHFKKIEKILAKGGRYYLMIPDKRFCFDHYVPESKIDDVLSAYNTQNRTHTDANVIIHRSLTTHNDTERHWKGDHADPGFVEGMADRIRSAVAEIANSESSYVDVHAWQFTPSGFRLIMDAISSLNLTQLRAERIYNTPRGRNEFVAVLSK